MGNLSNVNKVSIQIYPPPPFFTSQSLPPPYPLRLFLPSVTVLAPPSRYSAILTDVASSSRY